MSPSNSAAASKLLTVVIVTITVAILHLGKEILLPFAFATLLSFLLSPAVSRLERWRVPRAVAVLAVTSLVLVFLFGISWLFVGQIVDLAKELPKYEDNLHTKLAAIRHPWEDALSRASETISGLQEDITAEAAKDGTAAVPTTTNTGATTAEAPLVAPGPSANSESPATPSVTQYPLVVSTRQPLPVSLVGPTFSLFDVVRDWLGPLLAPLATLGIVTVLAIFMLMQREDLRNRLLRLFGEANLHAATQAMDDAARRVSRYLRMQLLINVIYGVAVGLGLLAFGLPNALLWGMLAVILRFIPFLGPWIAAGVASLLAVAVFDGWTRPLGVVAMFILFELVLNNVLEPLLYGSSTGISTIGIIVSAVFWTWLWGGVGLVLATPLTVCFVVLGRHVPAARFLTILLSDEQALPPAAQLYQRLLACDPDEASRIVDQYLKKHSRASLFDTVLVPALALAEHDRVRGDLSPEDRDNVLDAAEDIIENLQEPVESNESNVSAVSAGDGSSGSQVAPLRVACLPAANKADEIAAQMLADLLRQLGHEVEVVSARTLSSERADMAAESRFDVVVASAMMPYSAQRALYLCKRLRAKGYGGMVLAGLWSPPSDPAWIVERLKRSGVDRAVSSLSDAADQLRRWGTATAAARPSVATAT